MTSELGEFLKSSRSRTSPADVGIAVGGRRRVAGLRREEVAQIIGVSVDYYSRLEQGRELSPSAQVADALGRAFLLDEHGLAHLYRLARLTPRRGPATTNVVDPTLWALMTEWAEYPTVLLGHAFDVIAANSLAEALFLGFPPRRNLIESMFLDSASHALYRDWTETAANTVAGFRLLHAAQPDDTRIRDVLQRLESGSPEFRSMWSDHLARGRRLAVKRLRHPVVGDLELQIQTFDVRSAPGQELIVYRAEPGTTSAAALARLGRSLTSSQAD
ncbi:helix-turn-helix transcriptional regulator [Leifsonia sp. 2TAF2]|uniref:helix-turn-helix transcriptional regulator n=1 Tax=Leifsonia sp. 2TAF2 TaxID=3233009 RepID=UPI003F97190F